jgi:membrane-associated phospholipid phosphatase
MFHKKSHLFLLLATVFGMNYVETMAENWLKTNYGLGAGSGRLITVAFQQFEHNLTFENHEATSLIAVYGYSVAYFFFLPVLGILVAACLAKRADVAGLRALSLAVTIDYLLSLPFFLFFPVPERWTSPDSAAILLSDVWSSKLIEGIRPLSGLDNSFPSFHVSMTVVIVLICFLFKLRFRVTAAILGSLIVISTFILGIHWIPDILAGFALGTLSAFLAVRLGAVLAKPSLRTT